MGDDVINILVFAFLYVIGLPLTTLIHEIGHAIGLVCSTKDTVASVYIGDFSNSNKENFRIGRVRFHISIGMGGICRYEKDSYMTKLQSVITTISGPLMSAFITFILYLFLHHPINKHYLITGLFLMNLIQFVVTVIPIIYPKWWRPYGGYPSDGYKVLKLLRGK